MRTHPGTEPSRRRGEEGIAIFTVLIFAFILTLTGASFFMLSYYETRQALYRQDSAEAFLLADGAVERARAELFVTGSYRGAVTGASLGRGTYDMVVADSTYGGKNAVFIQGTGHVGLADRRVEIFANVVPGIPPFLVMRNADVKGNFCLEGSGHVNGDGDFGPNDVHFNSGGCNADGSYEEGYEIKPPHIFTEPIYYPGNTYYFVKLINTAPPHARIFAADDTTDLTTALGDSLTDIISFKAGVHEIEFKLAGVKKYFDPLTGIFKMAPGDTGVVVNFAPGAAHPTVKLKFSGNSGTDPVAATIINTRFIGANLEDRIRTQFWTGGVIELDGSMKFEPLNGIAMITHDLDPAQAQSRIGTPAEPALTYVTRDVIQFAGGLEVHGAIIVLRDFTSRGTVDVRFNPDFMDLVPPYLKDIVFGTGIPLFLSWREVAAGT